MSFIKFKELNSFNNIHDINNAIVICQKKIFNLKIKRAFYKKINSHFFIELKRQIRQLNFKKGIFLKQNKND